MLGVEPYQPENAKENNDRKPNSALQAQILVLGFAGIILVGTLLLKLPIATENGISWLDALFTSTSAVTVTGLSVVGTAATFTTFGEIVILGLLQVGGIGFIILAVTLYKLIGRRVGVYERTLLTQTLGLSRTQGAVQLTITVVLIVVAIEIVGAILLFSQWVWVMDWPTAAYYAIFHSISAFCNAGFDLFTGMDDPRLIATRDNPIQILILSGLITIGMLGIPIIYDIMTWRQARYLSLHTQLVLPLTAALIVVGTGLLLLDEQFVAGDALAGTPFSEQVWLSFFSIVSSRTAGITLISMNELGPASQLVILLWMFVGGAPASMAGGVGLSTVAVLLVTLRSTVQGYHDTRVLGRTLPTETITKAIAVITVSALLVSAVTIMMLFAHEGELFPVAFEVVSAFSNTGYSLGVTGDLDTIGKLLLAFTMFWGRLGPLTLVVALAQRDDESLIRFPEERIIIG